MSKEYLAEFEINMHDVKEHYKQRKEVSKRLMKLLDEGSEREYVELAVGVTDPLANYSAHEHQLGPRILAWKSHNKTRHSLKYVVNTDN